MAFNLLNDRWYFIITNESQYQKIKLICDYYGMCKYLPEKLRYNQNVIYNGYSYLDLMDYFSQNFDNGFKRNFTEITINDILNYNDERE